MASQQLRTITKVLRTPGAMRCLGLYTDWQDVLALLDTCRATRAAFVRDPDAVLAAFVPAFNRLLPLKDGEPTVRIDIEQWVQFMHSLSEPLARYPTLALSLLTHQHQNEHLLLNGSNAALNEELQQLFPQLTVSAAEDEHAHRLEQFALAHTRMVLLMRSRAPPLTPGELEDPPFRPTLSAPRHPDERELIFPAPLAYFDESTAPSVMVGSPSAPVQSHTKHHGSKRELHRQSSRLSKLFTSSPRAPPPAPQRDKRVWYPSGSDEIMSHSRRTSEAPSMRRMSKHVYSASEDGTLRTSRTSMYSPGSRSALELYSPGSASGSDRAVPSFDVNAHSPHSIMMATSRARAVVLRLFVPCSTLDEDTVKECVAQLQEEGLWKHVRPGDVLCNLGHVPETPEGSSGVTSDAGAWLIVDNARQVRVWHPHTPPPLDPSTLLNILNTPFFYSHLSAPPPSSGSNTPTAAGWATPMPLSSRGSMYSSGGWGSASTPSLHQPMPFFAQSPHKRPGSAGSIVAGTPPSARSSSSRPVLSRTTSVTHLGSPPGQDPHYRMVLPPLGYILTQLGIQPQTQPGSDMPGVSWLLSPQASVVPLRPRIGTPDEHADRAHAKRWTWLAIIDLRRGKGAPLWPTVSSTGAPTGGVPPVPPLPGWVPRRPKMGAASGGSSSSSAGESISTTTTTTFSPVMTPSTSISSHSQFGVESNGLIAPGWMREWILEVEGTVEGRRSLENVLRGNFAQSPSANGKPQFSDSGEREWEIIREKCGVGRVWMRLVHPSEKQLTAQVASPHEQLAMSHGLQSRAQGQLPARLDPRAQVDPQFVQRAQGAQNDMHLQQPPREHRPTPHDNRRPAEHVQRVGPQVPAPLPDYSDPRNRDPWAALAGAPSGANSDWQNMQHNRKGVPAPPPPPSSYPVSAPGPSQQQQHRLPKQAHPHGPQQPHPQPPNGFASPPRISLDSSGGHGKRGTSPRPLPQPPQSHGGSPVFSDPHQTPMPTRNQEQWLQQPMSQSPPPSTQASLSLASPPHGAPSSRHSGSAAPSLRTEGSKTSLASSVPQSVGGRSDGTGESSHSSKSAPGIDGVAASIETASASEQVPPMPRLPNILAANSRPVEEGSPSRAVHIPLPQSPERPHQMAAFIPSPPQASSTSSLPPTLTSPIDVSAFYPAAVASASPSNSSSASAGPPPLPPKQPMSDPGRHRMSHPPAMRMPHGPQAPTSPPVAYGRPAPGAQVPHAGQPYPQQMYYAQRPPQPQQHRGPPPPHHPHPHHLQQHPTPPPQQQHVPRQQPGSVFSSATGLVPPPPSGKPPSRKLTRKKVVSALIPGR